MSLLSYKGYHGSIEVEDDFLFGHALGLKNTIISYEGKNVEELRKDFKAGIDDYVSSCKADHVEAEKTKNFAVFLYKFILHQKSEVNLAIF